MSAVSSLLLDMDFLAWERETLVRNAPVGVLHRALEDLLVRPESAALIVEGRVSRQHFKQQHAERPPAERAAPKFSAGAAISSPKDAPGALCRACESGQGTAVGGD